MRIAVIGAGLSGCTIARLLKDRGHGVIVYEKADRPGGLCQSAFYQNRPYQLFGPHNFHTGDGAVAGFIRRFAELNNYLHRVATFVGGRILPYPISLRTIDILEEKDIILRELSRLPERMDTSNFKACVVSMIGETLYNKFIGNYTVKFWGVAPEEMDAGWAPKKIEIREDDGKGYFNDEWQGLPVGGYQQMFEEMIKGIPVRYNSAIKDYSGLDYDLTISTIPVDELFDFCYGALSYRGIDFTFCFDEKHWEDDRYGCINYPESNVAFTRRCNYNICYGLRDGGSSVVGYEFPSGANRMYPVYTQANRAIFNRYLARLVRVRNLLSIGRLGLFRYYDMDETVKWCLDNIEAVERYPGLSAGKRMELLTGGR